MVSGGGGGGLVCCSSSEAPLCGGRAVAVHAELFDITHCFRDVLCGAPQAVFCSLARTSAEDGATLGRLGFFRRVDFRRPVRGSRRSRCRLLVIKALDRSVLPTDCRAAASAEPTKHELCCTRRNGRRNLRSTLRVLCSRRRSLLEEERREAALTRTQRGPVRSFAWRRGGRRSGGTGGVGLLIINVPDKIKGRRHENGHVGKELVQDGVLVYLLL